MGRMGRMGRKARGLGYKFYMGFRGYAPGRGVLTSFSLTHTDAKTNPHAYAYAFTYTRNY